jgi:transcriptional regulator with GAF, ATPase, and Fis domain
MSAEERAHSPSVWYRAHDVPPSAVATVLATLRQNGIETEPDEAPPGGGCGILFFSQFSASLLTLIEQLLGQQGSLLCVAIGDERPASHAVWQLLSAGARDVIVGSGQSAVEQIAARLKRWHEVERLLESDAVAQTLVGVSTVWRDLLRQVVEVARFTDIPVLIIGETGTGKELIAKLIHDLDRRQNRREMVTADCTTIVPELSGSELFGHERGAFTGAVSARDGAFALAHHGTLFLDEVGELPPALQAQLLRAIQEKIYKRVGGNTWQQTEFRLVCATNRDLLADVKSGVFRSDLYYRIASWVVKPPPLKDRREDILPLTRHFLASLELEDGPVECDLAVAEYLQSREYPGNVRELRQLVMRMGQRHVGPGPITVGDLPAEEWPTIQQAAGRVWPDAEFSEAIRRGLESGAALREISHAASEAAIQIAVQQEQGNLQKAAKRLGVTDRALQLRRAATGNR